MSTVKQIEANRRNARKSTGPRTLRGKEISRFNALNTGIDSNCEVIPGEDCDELAILTAHYDMRWVPVLPEERFLVDSLVHADWLQRRLRKAEAQFWIHIQRNNFGFEVPRGTLPMGMAVQNFGAEFNRLQRRIDSNNRTYERNLVTLNGMIPDPPVAGQPETLPVPPPDEPQIGFVPHIAALPDSIEMADLPAAPPPEIGFVPQIALPPAAAPAPQTEPGPEGAPSASEPPSPATGAIDPGVPSSPPAPSCGHSNGGARLPAHRRASGLPHSSAPPAARTSGRTQIPKSTCQTLIDGLLSVGGPAALAGRSPRQSPSSPPKRHYRGVVRPLDTPARHILS
jgi:hypothetical protein